MMISRVCILAFSWVALASSVFAAGNLVQTENPDLIYDPGTGNVTLVGSTGRGEGKIMAFVLVSQAGSFKPLSDADFRAATPWEEVELMDPLGNPYVPPRFLMDNTPYRIGSGDPVLNGSITPINLGNIFPTGLNLDGLNSLLSTAEVSWAIGPSGRGSLDICGMCPEPVNLGLCVSVIGLLGVQGMVRRRSCRR